jgi:hypothetical protein
MLPATALADDGDDSDMPNIVTLGVAPLDALALRGRVPKLDAIPRETISGWSLTAGYGLSPLEDFELHLRFAYRSPYTFVKTSDDDLHLFDGSVRLLFRSQLSPRAQLYAAFDGGSSFAVVDEIGAGASLGAALGVRGWLTDHTGVWAEVGMGYAATRFDNGDALQIGTPVRMTFGWADRF